MAKTGIDREILSSWTDLHGHGLGVEQGTAWHRVLNESLAAFAQRHAERFSVLASGYLPDAARAARELEFAVTQLGAVGAVAATHVEGTNLGELALDEYWAAAVELAVPVFLHPVQPNPTPRTRRFAMNQVVQYTVDTTLCVGSLIGAGVLDRFPGLELILSHGGGTVPYVIGHFDVMFQRTDRAAARIATTSTPSSYLAHMPYDTVLPDPPAPPSPAA